jgi:hypothetical protein
MSGTRTDHGENGAIIAAIIGAIGVILAALIPIYLHARSDTPPSTNPATHSTAVAEIFTSKESGPRGAQLDVSGQNFDAGELIEIRVDTQRVATTRADSRGAFTNVQITIPSQFPANWQATIIATGRTSVKSATQPFQISG